jgi:hypothetical protein
MAQEFDDTIFAIRPVTLGTSSGSSTYGGGKVPWGFLRVSFNDSPAANNSAIIPQLTSDPPIPPVWPVLAAGKFASDTIYGSERMNTNIRFVRGNTYVIQCQAILDGAVVDISTKTLTLTVRKNINDAAAFLTLSSPSSGITITDAANGKFTCTFESSLTSSLPGYVQRFPYDITMTSGSVKNTLTRGYLIIVPGVT